MATIKSHTDLQQSKKLAEILPLESADMNWHELPSTGYFVRAFPYKHDNGATEGIFPCWSFAALLDTLPNKLQIVLAINDFQGDRKEKYVIGSVEHDRYDCYAENPVDACVAMILKLHELNLL